MIEKLPTHLEKEDSLENWIIENRHKLNELIDAVNKLELEFHKETLELWKKINRHQHF